MGTGSRDREPSGLTRSHHFHFPAFLINLPTRPPRPSICAHVRRSTRTHAAMSEAHHVVDSGSDSDSDSIMVEAAPRGGGRRNRDFPEYSLENLDDELRQQWGQTALKAGHAASRKYVLHSKGDKHKKGTCMCSFCGKIVPPKGGDDAKPHVGNITRHLKACVRFKSHFPDEFRAFEASNAQPSPAPKHVQKKRRANDDMLHTQSVISVQTGKVLRDVDVDVVERRFALFAAVTGTPFHRMDHPMFAHALKAANPYIQLRDRRTIAAHIDTMAGALLDRAKEDFMALQAERSLPFASGVLDVWSSSTLAASYLGYLTNFVTRPPSGSSSTKWQFNTAVVAHNYLGSTKTADRLAAEQAKIFKRVGLKHSNFMAIVTDGEATMAKLARSEAEPAHVLDRVVCLAHTIALPLREMIYYKPERSRNERPSRDKPESFYEAVMLPLKKLVKAFRRPKLRAKMKELFESSADGDLARREAAERNFDEGMDSLDPPTALSKDCATRWTGAYRCIASVRDNFSYIKQTLEHRDIDLAHEFNSILDFTAPDSGDGPPKLPITDVLHNTLYLLEPSMDFTKKVQSDDMPLGIGILEFRRVLERTKRRYAQMRARLTQQGKDKAYTFLWQALERFVRGFQQRAPALDRIACLSIAVDPRCRAPKLLQLLTEEEKNEIKQKLQFEIDNVVLSEGEVRGWQERAAAVAARSSAAAGGRGVGAGGDGTDSDDDGDFVFRTYDEMEQRAREAARAVAANRRGGYGAHAGRNALAGLASSDAVARGMLETSAATSVNVFEWWGQNEAAHDPRLVAIALSVLAVCATSAAAERLFSNSGIVDDCLRSSLEPERMCNNVLLMQMWRLAMRGHVCGVAGAASGAKDDTAVVAANFFDALAAIIGNSKAETAALARSMVEADSQ